MGIKNSFSAGKKILLPILISITCGGFMQGCSSFSDDENSLPSQSQYPGYKIVDARDRPVVTVSVDTSDSIAVVVRDIATTSYSYLEPRFNNSMVSFEGKSTCCLPSKPIMGNSGLAVFRFKFIGKGNSTISLVARQKGLKTTPKRFETDQVTEIKVEVE